MFKCKNCGGKMVFDIPSQTLKCLYCGTAMQPEEYTGPTDALEEVMSSDYASDGGVPTEEGRKAKEKGAKTYETRVFICEFCGAELTSLDEEMVTFCSYCGSQAMLRGKITEELSPKEIIPFRISKKQCQQSYETRVKGDFFLPKELKDAKFIEQFRGIYIPHWAIDVEFPKETPMYVTQTVSLGGNHYQESTYKLSVKAFHNRNRYLRDASANLDDTISQEIDTYTGSSVAFHPGYLAGFYADRADVPPQKYMDSIKEQAVEEAFTCVEADMKGRGMHLSEVAANPARGGNLTFRGITEEEQKEGFTPILKSYYTKLAPVWFLTWKNKDRLAYVVMNGETGTMHMDRPVDKKKYLLTAAGIAVVLFAVMSLFLTLTAIQTLSFACVCAAIMLILTDAEVQKLMEKELHVHDIGYRNWNPGLKKLARKRKGIDVDEIGKFSWSKVIFFYIIMTFAVPFFELIFNSGSHYLILNIASALAMAVGLVATVRTLINVGRIEEKYLKWGCLASFLPIVAAFVLSIVRPAADWWYYTVTILIAVGTLVPSLQLIDIYNLLSTRPLPSFFGREGGLNRADN